ncbi:MAG: hydrogenase 2 operon protein HybA [Caldithrix sp.]|nr:hydrogenase 2 operon protein HybA [Caldithrix sp.]
MNIERRDFFKILSVGAAAAVGTKPAQSREWQHRGRNDDAPAILYDATLCIGCKTCEVGCKEANDLQTEHSEVEDWHGVDGVWDSSLDLSVQSYVKIKMYKNGDGSVKDREVDGYSFIRSACMHCAEPDCQSVCPTSALIKDDKTGIVSWNIDACCGCRYCQVACPYLVPKFEYGEAFPKLQKCFFCEHRIVEGQIPGCCEACPTGATIYGKYKDVLAEAKQRVVMKEGTEYDYPVHTVDGDYTTKQPIKKYINHVYGETEGGGTQYIVLSAVPFEKLGLPNLPAHSASAKSEKLQHTLYHNLIAPLVLLGGLIGAAYRNTKKEDKIESGRAK